MDAGKSFPWSLHHQFWQTKTTTVFIVVSGFLSIINLSRTRSRFIRDRIRKKWDRFRETHKLSSVCFSFRSRKWLWAQTSCDCTCLFLTTTISSLKHQQVSLKSVCVLIGEKIMFFKVCGVVWTDLNTFLVMSWLFGDILQKRGENAHWTETTWQF